MKYNLGVANFRVQSNHNTIEASTGDGTRGTFIDTPHCVVQFVDMVCFHF